VRAATDTDLPAACIEPSLGEGDFFLRKAIGRALRERGKSDPAWVAEYVRREAGRLSRLSRREATRHLAGTLSP
jgi:3-methyladenine DNA glycosylase AlkD